MPLFSLRRAAVALLFAGPLIAQDPGVGRVTGRVFDAKTGNAISDAGVQIVGTTLGAQTGIDGSFSISRVPAGNVTIQVRHLGFQPKQITGLRIEANSVLQQDVTLLANVAKIEGVVVSATAERGSVDNALDAQRSATGVVNSVTSEQIARSPDGDAAQAISRVSSVTTDQGKVAVRGLSGRYTTTSLNNTRVPSPEPETRVVPLDMFPAGLLQSITTFKTFTPDQQGDFAGAVVDIKTKEFPAKRTMVFQVGSGYAAGATGSPLQMATSVGGERLGAVNHGRDLPESLRSLGNFQNVSLTQADINSVVKSFRDSWQPQHSTGGPLVNGSATIGGNDPVFGHRFGYLVSATLSSGADAKEGQRRAHAYPGGTKGVTVEGDPFTGSSSSQGVLWGGMGNLSTLIGKMNRLSFNGLYNRSADNSARVEDGFFTYDAIPVRLTRMQYVQRSLHSAQLAGEHELAARQRIEWRATASGVRRYEPDRSEFAQVIEHDTPGGPPVYRWLTGGSGGAVRTFSDLSENSDEYAANYQIRLGAGSSPSVIKSGVLYRATARTAESNSYVISARNASNAVRELPPDAIFDGRFTQDTSTLFSVGPLSQGGSYGARDHLSAAFLMADIPIGQSVRIIGGARYEADHLEMHAVSTLGAQVNPVKDWNDVLPSLAVNIQLPNSQQLRLSVSRTLARPEYREVTPIISRDVIGGENVQGDESLTRTNVSNADIRWEAYPNPGEIIGISVFAKHFENPIEKVAGSGSGGTSFVFFTNAASADNVGVELELRRNLGDISDALAPLTLFTNMTAMHSQIHLTKNNQASATNQSRAMVGQAPYVINAGATYSPFSETWSATLLYNRTGPRITAAGGIPLPDVVEDARDIMDFSLRTKLRETVTLRVDAKNLLDAPYTVSQGSVTREFYRSGRTLQAGVVLRP